jgi:hypothetical protein
MKSLTPSELLTTAGTPIPGQYIVMYGVGSKGAGDVSAAATSAT